VQDSQCGWHEGVKPKYFAIFWLLLIPHAKADSLLALSLSCGKVKGRKSAQKLMKQVLLNFKVCIKRVDIPKVLPVTLNCLSVRVFVWLPLAFCFAQPNGISIYILSENVKWVSLYLHTRMFGFGTR